MTEIGKGDWVEIYAGQHRGKSGLVFWSKYSERTVQFSDCESSIREYKGVRIGFTTARGEKLYASADQARVIEPPTGALKKGDQVRWTEGSAEGTGVIFWYGSSKHGQGMRVGLRDDASKETRWLDADHVTPLTKGGLDHLRGLLFEEPSAELFEAIALTLDGWTDTATREVGLAYAMEHLEAWPDALRVLPERWYMLLYKDKPYNPIQALPVVRTFYLRRPRRELTWVDEEVRGRTARELLYRLSRSKGVRVAELDLSFHAELGRDNASGARSLEKVKILGDLRRLVLDSCGLGREALLTLSRIPWFSKVTHLALANNAFVPGDLAAILQTDALKGVTHLDLSHNNLGVRDLDAIARATHLDALGALVHLTIELGHLKEELPRSMASSGLPAHARRRFAAQMSVKSLKALAKEQGLKGYSRMSKATLLDLLTDHWS